MIFTKESLLPVVSFVGFKKNNYPYADKIWIKTYNSIVFFIQTTNESQMVYGLETDCDEDISLSYATLEFVQLLQLVNDKTNISITTEGIFLGDSSKYQLQSYSDILFDFIKLENVYETFKERSDDIASINNFSKLIQVSQCMGVGDLKLVNMYEGSYLCSDSVNLTGMFFSKESNGRTFFISPEIKKLDKLHSALAITDDNFEVDVYKDYLKFDYGNLKVYVAIYENSAVPNLFADDYLYLYNLKYTIELQRNDFLQIFKRLNIVANTTKLKQIKMKFIDNKLVFSTIQGNYAEEKIAISYDSALEGIELKCPITYLINALLFIKTDIIKIKLDETDLPAIPIYDSTEDTMFLLNIY